MALDAVPAGSQIMVKTKAKELTLQDNYVQVKATNMDRSMDIKTKIVTGRWSRIKSGEMNWS